MINIIPKPQQLKETGGKLTLNGTITISGCLSENLIKQCKNLFSFLQAVEFNSDGIINLVQDSSIVKEGYKLVINDKVTIYASEDSGFYYGLITIYQLLKQNSSSLPTLEINDYPRFSYRGFMLDVGRYFYSVSDVKKFIDIMALLKLNKFHFHLTEDQGWRVQIDKYPLLTEKGSKRSHTNFNHTPHGGYYTKADIKQIVDYAHERYIIVIPEIDMPAHMVSAISSYSYLSCFDRDIEVATHFGVKHDILCAGKDTTYTFVKDVLTEVFEMFPDGYIHLGGDEAVKVRWQICPYCQKKMHELGVNENELQSVFMEEIASFARKNGFKPIIWNETSEDKIISKDIIYDYYMPEKPIEKLMIDEVNSGRKIINACSNAYYYDLPYHDVPLQYAYEYEPVVEGMNKDNVLGIEANLWTEYVKDMKTSVKRLFPRVFAMAETSWVNADRKNYSDFTLRADSFSDIVEEISGYKPSTVKQATLNKVQSFFEKMWFEKRVFHWEGIHIPLDNLKVQIKYKNKTL